MSATIVVLLVMTFGLLQVLESVDGCQLPVGWTPPSAEEEVFNSYHFIYGSVRRTYRYVNPEHSWYNSLYIAEVDVYCIMKGHRTPAIVNVTHVGYMPGFCFSTELEAGKTYAILTSSLNGELVAQRTIEADAEKLRQLARVCGLQTQYPFGGDEAAMTCPVAASEDQCLGQDFFDSLRPPPAVISQSMIPTKRRRGTNVLERLMHG